MCNEFKLFSSLGEMAPSPTLRSKTREIIMTCTVERSLPPWLSWCSITWNITDSWKRKTETSLSWNTRSTVPIPLLRGERERSSLSVIIVFYMPFYWRSNTNTLWHCPLFFCKVVSRSPLWSWGREAVDREGQEWKFPGERKSESSGRFCALRTDRRRQDGHQRRQTQSHTRHDTLPGKVHLQFWLARQIRKRLGWLNNQLVI